MNNMQTFGDPERFQISARWVQDSEPRDRLPKEYGWSMGELCIKVGGVTVTEHRIHGESKDAIQWYLGPIVSWLIRQWKWLMHEEAYTWHTRSGDSAAITVAENLERYIASEYPPDRGVYKIVREWWGRHALRSADSSALYPDIFFRRVDDNIEISWLDSQPEFSPAGFELNLKPGTALFPVDEIANSLWSFVKWAIESAPSVVKNECDLKQVDTLRSHVNSVRQIEVLELEAAHLADATLCAIVERVRAECKWVPIRKVLTDIPVVTEFDAPALMFGGLNVNIGEVDVRLLFDILVKHRNGAELDQLKQLVSSPSIYEYIHPYAHGYELAYEVRRKLGIDNSTIFIDVEKIILNLGIEIRDEEMETNNIRGVAVAGAKFSPAILINRNSLFNENKRGRRFTLAHEFCHILFDRSNAKCLSHISGPWASARVEKRANAFAAMFLATPHALVKNFNADGSRDRIKYLSEKFMIGTRALREHMHNLDLISDYEFLRIKNRSH